MGMGLWSDYTTSFPLPAFGILLPTTKMKITEDVLGIEYDIENIKIEGINKFLVLSCKQKQQK